MDAHRPSDPSRRVPVIAGSGRSGTTWVLDALAVPNGLRTIFEPLHPACVPGAAPFAHRYVAEGDEAPDLGSFFDGVLDGRARGIWIDYRVRSDRLRPRLQTLASIGEAKLWAARVRKVQRNRRRFRPQRSAPVIVKLIRGNLLIGWLARNRPVRIALIVRHPGAVFESKQRMAGDDWDPLAAVRPYLEQPRLLETLDCERFAAGLASAAPMTQHTAAWCFENALPLRHARDWGVHVVYYEQLVTDAAAWQGLGEALGLARLPGPELLGRASDQADPLRRRDSYTSVGRWIDAIDAADRDRGQAVLERFGVRCYRMDEALPQAAGTPPGGAAAATAHGPQG